MSPEIVVSLVSAAVALGSVVLSARAARQTAQLNHELEMAKSRATKEELVEELMSRYREPLLRAAYDLQSRIYNIIRQEFLVRYGGQGREHEQAYAVDNTLFLFAEYFGWVEILRRDVQFLDLGDVERNRLLVERLEAIGDTFASDRKVLAPSFRIFRGDQRALGELMIPSSSDSNGGGGGGGGGDRGGERRHCIGYARFRDRLHHDPAFAAWFQPLAADVSALALAKDDAGGHERLTRLQHDLIDLISFLDDPPRRFLREYCTKL